MAGYSSTNDPRSRWYHKYNILSRIYFIWVDCLFCLGCKRSLEQDDLYQCPSETDSKRLLQQFNSIWTKELERNCYGSTPRLWLAVGKCFWWRIVLQGILTTVMVAVLTSQPILVGYFTDYFTIESPTSLDTQNAYLFAVGLALLALAFGTTSGLRSYVEFKLGMMIRIVTLSSIYQKILRLSQTTVTQQTIGHVVSLASNDVHRFNNAIQLIHFIWLAPVHLVVATYIIYTEIGATAFLAVVLIAGLMILQYIFAKLFTMLRLRAAKKTDTRVLIMNQIISGIRIIKMYGWEYAFKAVIEKIRKSEVNKILKGSIFRAITLSYLDTVVPLLMFTMFSVYVSIDEDNTLNPRIIFTVLSLLTNTRLICNYFMSYGIINLSEGVVAINRITNFLVLEDLNYNKRNITDGEIGIKVNNLSASWLTSHTNKTLSDVTFQLKSKSLLAVIGAVGSGKSSLLQCLINELPPLSGSVYVTGTIGYVSQEPWIYSATLRENVLFGKDYDSNWYDTVINACALDKDINLLPDGDATLIGERGVTLSGGQKARVNLARAVYHKADVYLLDDPLSAVDSAVSRHIFDNCIKGLLSDCCVVLVTHQLGYINECDQIVGLKEGVVIIEGNCKDVLAVNSSEIFDLIGEHNFEVYSSTSEYRKSNDVEKSHPDNDFEARSSDTNDNINENAITNKALSEERSHGSISLKSYVEYFKAGGGYVFTCFVAAMFVVEEMCTVTSDWWISDWSECDANVTASHPTCFLSDSHRIATYSVLVVSILISSLSRLFLFYVLALTSARVLHNRMFQAVLKAPILFFDTKPIGQILNRFSKDIGFIDDILIFNFCEFTQLLFRFFAVMITAVIAIPYFVIPMIFLSTIFIFFRWYYLKTSRDIKRLEALARSPLYSQISATLRGLSTIRAYNMQSKSMDQFHHYHNCHTQAWYLYLVTARWFALRVDNLCGIFVIVLCFATIPLSESLNAGLVGLAVTYCLSLMGILQYCIRLSTEVESHMVSVERVLEYSCLQSEASLETQPVNDKPPPDWPHEGQIIMQEVSYRHSNETPFVLKNVSCAIHPQEKIGIVGRTGAGKSSLIAALFRLSEPTGSIVIDSIDCTKIGLHDLRCQLSIIPQDPVLFSGTVRYNVDPFNVYTDDHIWRALEQVQLMEVVNKFNEGLEATVREGGTNFSVGEKQLFCLARALLKNNKILILDEATANVDLETDAIIQKVICDCFSHCTMLIIAHRLETVMDADRIMVLHEGSICEFDKPSELLLKPNSYLSYLVNETGTATAEKLKSIAFSVNF